MKKQPTFKALLSLLLISGSIVFVSCSNDDDMTTPTKPDIVFYGLTGANQIVTANANAAASFTSTTAVTGLQTGETLMAIDFRPATGQLYGLGSTSRIYSINTTSGAATAIGAGPFTPAINGAVAGFDFNPTVDRIRLVTSTGQNLRLHPETGAVAGTDVNLNPGSPSVNAVAYTNNFAGATATVLFDIDVASQKLLKQDNPNGGVLVEIGALGVAPTSEGGFDISPDNKIALASLNVGGLSGLYQVNLETGKATSLGSLATPLIGIAIPTNPVAYMTDAGNNLITINLNNGGTVSKAITGMAAAEMIMGMDFRPANGQLYVLGSSSLIYTINLGTGAATAVGSTFATALSGTSFGFDFNPTVDRIRVVSNTGQNLRLHPTLGGIAGVDGTLNPATPAVSAAAYTNNFAGATTTVLFDIDHGTDKLYTQIPPNLGTLVEVGALGINAEAANGFDIGGTSGKAWAVLTVGMNTKLYSINLTTGAATVVGDLPAGVHSLAVGLGF
ncbi:MAG: DUF4394 domain-containing protein [Chitinophagaceae bacterium]|nr:MAG: DUF4394 domain-containing protein [Chitinophagaceae bacterium]